MEVSRGVTSVVGLIRIMSLAGPGPKSKIRSEATRYRPPTVTGRQLKADRWHASTIASPPTPSTKKTGGGVSFFNHVTKA